MKDLAPGFLDDGFNFDAIGNFLVRSPQDDSLIVENYDSGFFIVSFKLGRQT